MNDLSYRQFSIAHLLLLTTVVAIILGLGLPAARAAYEAGVAMPRLSTVAVAGMWLAIAGGIVAYFRR